MKDQEESGKKERKNRYLVITQQLYVLDNYASSWLWWYMPVVSVLGRGGRRIIKFSLSYVVSLRPVWATYKTQIKQTHPGGQA